MLKKNEPAATDGPPETSHGPGDPSSTSVAPIDDGSSAAPSDGSRRIVGYVVGGVGLAAVLTGAAFGVHALVKGSEGNCDGPICENQDAIDAREAARSSATVANVAIGLGALAVGAGVVLVLTLPRRQEATSVKERSLRWSASPMLGGGAVDLGGRF